MYIAYFEIQKPETEANPAVDNGKNEEHASQFDVPWSYIWFIFDVAFYTGFVMVIVSAVGPVKGVA